MTAKTALASRLRVDPPGLDVILQNYYQVESLIVKARNSLDITLLNSQ